MPTDRRQFLRAASVASLAGLAGCNVIGGGSESPTATESNGGDATDGDGSDGQSADETPTATPTSGPALPRLSTDGKWVVDDEGNQVVLRGVNTVDPWWADEYSDLRGNSYAETLALATNREAAWYPRAIRIPCQPRSIGEVGVETFASEHLDPAIEHCREHGVYAIVDYHTIEPYTTDDVDSRIRDFWNAIAPRYADETHVLYELFNEPTEPYGNGLESWNTWRETAQPWVDLVREHAPDTPIVVGSPMWTSLTRFAPEAPFEGEDLIYAGHIYPSDGPNTWQENYGAPASDVPVMITEWGYLDVEGHGHDPHMRGTTSGWGEPFREWLDGLENVGWTAWCFDSVWDPQMFTANWDLMGGEYYMGEFTKRWLSERRNDGVPDTMAFEDAGTPTPPDDDAPPDPPTGVAVQSAGTTDATVTWEHASDDETSVIMYTVYANGEAAVRAGEKSTSATVTGLPAETDNELTVTATDAAGNESDPSELVTATTGEQTIHAQLARTDTAPTIDGEMTDGVWADATTHALENVLVEGVEGDSDLSAQWRARWSDEGLYVLVEVTDDSLSADSADAWNDDSVEIYVDGDNSKGGSYDGENDFQFIVPYDGDGVAAGGNSPDVGDARQAQTGTPDGWRVEFAVPWATVGVSPGAGDVVGFDVHVNDDDDGDGRDGKLGWFATEDNSWRNPGLFATVELVE